MNGVRGPEEGAVDSTFDLICLQDDEYYFRDYACSVAGGSDAAPAPAALKLCSASIYLVPASVDAPITRIPLESLATVSGFGPSNDDAPEEEASPDTSDTIYLTTETVVTIQRPPRAEPYTTAALSPPTPFKLTFSSPETAAAVLKSIEELREIAATRKAGKEEARAAAGRLLDVIAAHEAPLAFDPEILPPSERSEVVAQSRGMAVSPLVTEPGWVTLTPQTLCFLPCAAAASGTRAGLHRFAVSDAVQAGRRKYMLKDTALEILFKDKVSLFIAFPSGANRDAFEAALRQAGALAPPPALKQLTKDWTAGRLSNFAYLSALNEAAGRSFNDLTQYPVFPWILADYTSNTLDLSNPAVFRDLARPIAALAPSRVAAGREMHAALRAMGGADPPWMYGSHYSNPGAVVFYLVRRQPQLMLRLQGGRFDAPDRLFSSIAGAWSSVMRWNSDVKELIPEFYTPGAGDFLVNGTQAALGARADGAAVGDVELPPWASGPEDFLKKMADALESPAVSTRLHKWIDLVFGVKQRGAPAAAADNVFHFMTDDATALRYLESAADDPSLQAALEAQVREYGRTPTQLFKKKHPKRKGPSRMAKLLQACVCGVPPAAGSRATS